MAIQMDSMCYNNPFISSAFTGTEPNYIEFSKQTLIGAHSTSPFIAMDHISIEAVFILPKLNIYMQSFAVLGILQCRLFAGARNIFV